MRSSLHGEPASMKPGKDRFRLRCDRQEIPLACCASRAGAVLVAEQWRDQEAGDDGPAQPLLSRLEERAARQEGDHGPQLQGAQRLDRSGMPASNGLTVPAAGKFGALKHNCMDM